MTLPGLYTVEERDRVRDEILALARADPRVVAGALMGSLAFGKGDRWSDLDLSFGVADDASPHDVLGDWTERLARDFDAVHLFDLPVRSTIYRVFLFPHYLQVDLSVTPAADFGARGPKWELLFGSAVELPFGKPPPAEELFGYGAHHALHVRFYVERGRVWQAQHFLAELRNKALELACRRLGLPVGYGRGFDDLPPELLAGFEATFVRSLEREELLRALAPAIDLLLREADEVRELAAKLEPQLRALAS